MKRKYLNILIAVISIFFMSGACERDRKGDPIEIIVKNNTNDTICFGLQFNYPDTNIINQKEYPHLAQGTVSYPYSESGFWAFSGWEKTLRENYKINGVVCIVHSLDTIRQYPFEQIQEDYNILKRYILSIDDLKAINWTIVYP